MFGPIKVEQQTLYKNIKKNVHLSSISGAENTFAEGMTFTYDGPTSWIDRIGPIDGAQSLLINIEPVNDSPLADSINLDIDEDSEVGDYDVTLSYSEWFNQHTISKTDAFTVNFVINPEITSIIPNEVQAGTISTITINGYETNWDNGTQVSFSNSQIIVNSVFALSNNILIVAQGGDHPSLYHQNLSADSLHWISGEPPKNQEKLSAKIRYRQNDQDCQVISIDEDRCTVKFSSPQFAITPGQSIVFYDGETCLGGAIINDRS